MMTSDDISIIIPIFNEEKNIKNIVDDISYYKDKCEIIFVDGGSTDETLKLIPKEYCVLNGVRGRAKQMNLGAKEAKGKILFFVHCDSILPNDCLEEIVKLTKKYKAGCFKIKFDSKHFLMKCCEKMSDLRVKLRSIMFGDQGIFIEKELFFSLGGYPEIPIMEDYQFSINLKKNKVKIGMCNSNIISSERRFINGGRLRTMWTMHKLRFMYRRGEDVYKLAKLYKDIR